MPDISFFHKIYLKSETHWDGILNDLYEHDRVYIHRQIDYVDSMKYVFQRIIVRCIPF